MTRYIRAVPNHICDANTCGTLDERARKRVCDPGEDGLVCRDGTYRHQKHGEKAGWDTGSGYYYDIPNGKSEREENYTDAVSPVRPEV